MAFSAPTVGVTDFSGPASGGGPEAPSREARIEAQFETALEAEEAIGRRMSTGALLGGLLVVAVWLFIQLGAPRVLYYEAIIAGFAFLIGANYLLARSRFDFRGRVYVFLAVFIGLLVVTIIFPNPFVESWPLQTRLRFGNFVYVLAFLGPVALSFRPALMVWAGVVAALAWGAGVAWVMALPESRTWADFDPAVPGAQILDFYFSPYFVDINARVQEGIAVLLLASVLALVSWRSRRLVHRQIRIARERANLARHFPPTVVDRLAQRDQPLGATRSQPVAVMFADIVGFTRIAERSPPDEVVATLRRFHALVEANIFEHHGTLDKFLGDGVMATFGTPDPGPRDAANALVCAHAMQAAIDRWNQERVASGEPSIRLSIGLHHGDVILGDIGSARRLEFAVLGDVVNVAQRLEALTRELSCRVVVSDDLLGAIGDRTDPELASLTAGLTARAPQNLRGREQPIAVWTLGGVA